MEYYDLQATGSHVTGCLRNLTDRPITFAATLQFVDYNNVVGSLYVHEHLPPKGTAKFKGYSGIDAADLGVAQVRWVVTGLDTGYSAVFAPCLSSGGSAGPSLKWSNLVLEKSDFSWRLRGIITYSGPNKSSIVLTGYVLDGTGKTLASETKRLFDVTPGSRQIEIKGSLPSNGLEGIFRYGIGVN